MNHKKVLKEGNLLLTILYIKLDAFIVFNTQTRRSLAKKDNVFAQQKQSVPKRI